MAPWLTAWPGVPNALVLLDDGMSCGNVARVLLLDDDTVRTWYRLYEEEGIDGLVSFGYDGSACRLSDAQQGHFWGHVNPYGTFLDMAARLPSIHLCWQASQVSYR